MWEVDATIIGGWIGSVMWPFFRIGAFLMVAPIIGTRLVPARVRVILSVLISALLIPHLPEMPIIDALSLSAYVLIAQQVLIGIAMAFVLTVLLHMFVVAGQMMAMQMGLGFASMVDPTNGVSVTVLSQFHLMLVTLLFLGMNGHLAMIEVLAESFRILPVGAGFMLDTALYTLAGWASWMFAGALLMAMPAVTSLLIVNSAIGVVTRAAPQLNIMTIGFPSMLVLGLCIVWAGLGGYMPHFEVFTRESLELMANLLRS